MEKITFLAIYVALVPVCWKTFNYFNMTLVDAAMMTGFTYHLKKLAFALFAPLVIGALAVTLIFNKDRNNQANAVTESVRLEPIPQAPPMQPSEPVVSEPINPGSKTEVLKHAASEPVGKNCPKKDLLNQEGKAQYLSDDRIVQQWLRLREKPASQN